MVIRLSLDLYLPQKATDVFAKQKPGNKRVSVRFAPIEGAGWGSPKLHFLRGIPLWIMIIKDGFLFFAILPVSPVGNFRYVGTLSSHHIV